MFRHTRDSRLLFQQNLFIRLCWVQQTDFTAFIRLLSAAKFKNHDLDPSFQPGLTRFILVENTADTVESRATYLFVACKFQAQQQAFFIAVCDISSRTCFRIYLLCLLAQLKGTMMRRDTV